MKSEPRARARHDYQKKIALAWSALLDVAISVPSSGRTAILHPELNAPARPTTQNYALPVSAPRIQARSALRAH
jgi:hypothetical protein